MLNFNININLRIIALACIAIVVGLLGSCKKNVALQTPGFKVYGNDSNVLGFQAVALAGVGFAFAAQNNQNNPQTSLYGTDAHGNLLWKKELPCGGTPPTIEFSCIAATPDGGVIIGGYDIAPYPVYSFDSTTNSTVYLYHFTVNGANDWTDTIRQRGQVGALALCQAPDGNIEVAAFLSVDTEINLINVSQSGQINSKVPLNTADTFFLYPQSITGVGNDFVITGPSFYYVEFIPGSYYTLVGHFSLRTTPFGNTEWLSTNYSGFKLYQPVQVLIQGNSIIEAGDTAIGNSWTSVNIFRGNPLQVSFDNIAVSFRDPATGAVTQTAIFSSDTADVNGLIMNPFVTATTDGGCLIGATGNLDRSIWQAILIKTDASLNQLWRKPLNYPDPAQCFGVIQTHDGGYMVFLNVQSFGNAINDFAVIRVDASGNIVVK